MDDYIPLIKNTRLFSSLDEETCKQLLPQFIQVELRQGEILFRQGDPSDSIFIVVHGKLIAEFTTGMNIKPLGKIAPGDVIGEIGALSKESRALEVKALQDCVLLKLRSEVFIDICYKHPTVMFETFRPVIKRSRDVMQMLSAEKKLRHVVVVPAHKEICLEKFSEKLMTIAEKFNSVLILSDYQTEFKHIDIATTKERIHNLVQDKPSHHKVIYILKSYDTPLARACFNKADMVYIAAQSKATPKIDPHILDKIHSQRAHLMNDPGLILLHPEGTSTPQHTAEWLAQTQFSMSHHLRMNMTKDFHRLLRFMRGKAVGLVLSGGGTRGWAHLGAIKALHEAKIPIDMIGGTSVGALIGGCYAMNESYEEVYEDFYKIVMGSNHSVSWRSLTWPAISLFNAKNFTSLLHETFRQRQIEDLWLPYFCITCNLTNNSEDTHRSGLLWEKVRASTSIPGLIPPMIINGELHLDGGLLNNLPVDVMRQYIGNKAKVIAIDLFSFSADNHKYDFPPVLTFNDAFLSKFGIGSYGYKFPRFTDIFLRGLFVGSLSKTKQNSLAANTFIALNLSNFRLLHSQPKQAERLIEIGYQETLAQIVSQPKNKDGIIF